MQYKVTFIKNVVGSFHLVDCSLMGGYNDTYEQARQVAEDIKYFHGEFACCIKIIPIFPSV